jgi:hypothetical protein
VGDADDVGAGDVVGIGGAGSGALDGRDTFFSGKWSVGLNFTVAALGEFLRADAQAAFHLTDASMERADDDLKLDNGEFNGSSHEILLAKIGNRF